MIQTVWKWMRDHGGLALLAVGLAIYLVLLVLDLLVGWRLAYPYNIAWVGVVAIPAAGVAILYLQTWHEDDDDRPVEGKTK